MNPLMLATDKPGRALVVSIDGGDGPRPVARRVSPAAVAIVGGVER